MTEEELDESLRRFYAEARTKTGQEYSRSSLLGFRNSVERYLNANNRLIKITRNPTFSRSNKMLESKLKAIRREGKENIQHKPVIESADLVKINNSPFMSPNTADGLLRKVWFYVTLYWCRRGCEGQRLLRRDSFQFAKDAEGNDYIVMTHDELTKNHQGGFCEKSSEESQTRLYSTGQDGDAFWCLTLYIKKLNPQQEAFFQKPKCGDKFHFSDPVWYENKPFGVNRLAKIMREISLGANLSKTYTNHCVRATAITLWSDSCVPARHIMSISGHSNEQSLTSYNRRPSTSQLKNCSDILSSAIQNSQSPVANAHGQITSFAPAAARPSNSSTTSVSLMAPNASLGGIFNSCNIGQAQVFMLPQNGSMFSNP